MVGLAGWVELVELAGWVASICWFASLGWVGWVVGVVWVVGVGWVELAHASDKLVKLCLRFKHKVSGLASLVGPVGEVGVVCVLICLVAQQTGLVGQACASRKQFDLKMYKHTYLVRLV